MANWRAIETNWSWIQDWQHTYGLRGGDQMILNQQMQTTLTDKGDDCDVWSLR